MAGDRARRVIRRILTVLGRAYGRHAVTTDRGAIEELLLGIISDGTPERAAVTALDRLSSAFVDWNEVRVSSGCEIGAAMPGVQGAFEKGEMIHAVLNNVFDRMNEMSLEPLREKRSRDVAKIISGINGFPEAAVARAAIYGLGHTLMPLTPRVLSVCRRIGFVANGTDQRLILRAIETNVSDQRMYDFHWLLSRHAARVCLEHDPLCAACKLRSDCRTGRARIRALRKSSAGSKSAAGKRVASSGSGKKCKTGSPGKRKARG